MARASILALTVLALVQPVAAQQYRIGEPGRPEPTPVYLTQPVEGRVEVGNLPAVQDVRVVEGLGSPLEVTGRVALDGSEPLAVEVTNLPPAPESVEIGSPVRIVDEPPLRVWLENPPPPAGTASPDPRTYTAFAARGTFSSKETRVRQPFQPPEGRVFHLSDVSLDARPDAVFRVRVLAEESAVAGVVNGAGGAPVALAVLDSRRSTSVRLGTAAPLAGPFTVEVEALGPGQGAPFAVLLSGYLTGR